MSSILGLSSVRQVSSTSGATLKSGGSAATSARQAPTATASGSGNPRLTSGTASTVLGAQEQSARAPQAGGGQVSAASASGSTSTTLTPLEELLDTNGDGVVDWRDYVSSDEADAIETPTMTGYTSTGGAVTASVDAGKVTSVAA
ncbi:hypothetical protein VZ95_14565 [Elstera litoralis]|uniref:EF-hand domain-containing protein n=1 Tax=Elstera litoralis TaxID=552518 RepID=A0A0F3IQV1_9PROT|nr:hypothetical protein [Elstera litoralis]KJV08933.1 hypothetical protein VZ95_14565 [Elstera litoralis]